MTEARTTRRFGAARVIAGLLLLAGALAPGAVAAREPAGQLRATLDGKPLALEAVGRYYCHDFAYPEIRCFSRSEELEASLPSTLAYGGSDYVTIFDGDYYSGPYMHLSQDYAALSWIGWNDRVSSFIVRNSQSGAFWTDWFWGGSRWGFCCNSYVGLLGGHNNSFSSVDR